MVVCDGGSRGSSPIELIVAFIRRINKATNGDAAVNSIAQDDLVQNVQNITHSAKYSNDAWNALTINDRWSLLVEYEREVEKAMGLSPIKVESFLDSSGDVGSYSHSVGILYLNKVLLVDRDTALFVVRHELRHYYQNVLCDQLPNNSSSIPTPTIILWDDNRKNYITSPYEDYIAQPIEADADNWAELTR